MIIDRETPEIKYGSTEKVFISVRDNTRPGVIYFSAGAVKEFNLKKYNQVIFDLSAGVWTFWQTSNNKKGFTLSKENNGLYIVSRHLVTLFRNETRYTKDCQKFALEKTNAEVASEPIIKIITKWPYETYLKKQKL